MIMSGIGRLFPAISKASLKTINRLLYQLRPTLLADSAGVIRQRTNDDDSITVVDDAPHENKQP